MHVFFFLHPGLLKKAPNPSVLQQGDCLTDERRLLCVSVPLTAERGTADSLDIFTAPFEKKVTESTTHRINGDVWV